MNRKEQARTISKVARTIRQNAFYSLFLSTLELFIRFKHAGIYTPEYQPDLDFEDHYWEESRGMGYSYGYNREEDAWDYNATQSLVLQLIDKVSARQLLFCMYITMLCSPILC